MRTENFSFNFKEKMEKTRDKVKRILEKYPETRDNYNLLLYIYWFGDEKIISTDISEFRNLTSANTIARARRHLQKKYPELRGKQYKERKKQETEFRNYYINEQ